MSTYTQEEKSAYFKNLRTRWQDNKKLAEADDNAKARYQAMLQESPNMKISYNGFYFTLRSMHDQGLSGLPYIDAKTFNGWREAGFKVKKGEKGKIEGITWIISDNTKNEDSADEKSMYPKRYILFHTTQVEKI